MSDATTLERTPKGPTMKAKSPDFVSTTNACKLCTPLGASIVFRGIEGAIPFLHGSQGCATYMRRYIISHFREPIDIASSSLGEKQAIYGGGPNLKQGLLNVMKKYEAKMVGIATTCLTETIGDDVAMLLHEFKQEFGDLDLPDLVHVSTPSYSGSHMEGFQAAVKAVCDQMPLPVSAENPKHAGVNLLSGFVSPEDIRNARDIFERFGLPVTILPDYSETLDGEIVDDYQKLPPGGTPLASLKAMGAARATVEFGATLHPDNSGAKVLHDKFGVPGYRLSTPIGLRASDAFFETLQEISGQPLPARYAHERGRFLDALVDGHKYISGKRAVVYGEEELVVGLTGLLAEIGIVPVLVASGGNSGLLKEKIAEACGDLLKELPDVRPNIDFFEIENETKALKPDLILGNSKGHRIARDAGAPLIRVGFPIHDRFGAARMPHLFYTGTQSLFDRIVNAIIEKRQADNPLGWSYV
ncbi:nitrogenase component 1 [Megalodesulfovibrio gigas]|uniref:Putative Nitrogenase n=1 Tax=Megalodesulfovibrio gigas (strain ATCC 19364 / DSM 1382 / NCIMB 9332 / VKM B-1759) TaxID=1121448 RepID=T2G969_MEGG1|nr:putative Nitrogenase [Megalodesulfovibrio gigas DSM 1382 = ATCC 19364]